MLHRLRSFLTATFFGWAILLSAVPFAALAQTGSTATTTTTGDCPTGVVCLYNPLGTGQDSYDIRKLVGRIIKGVLSIIGTLAFLMFIYGGVLWLTSMGDPKRLQKGKDILVWTVAGLGVIFSSYAIVNAILNALTEGNVTGA